MTNEQKIAEVKALINDSSVSDETIGVYLGLAESKIYLKMMPFAEADNYPSSVPTAYEHIQTELASRYILRRGAEGQLVSNENGVQRTYGSVDDSDLLSRIVSEVGV